MLRAEERLVGAGKQGAAAGLLGKKRQADRSQSGGGGGAPQLDMRGMGGSI